MQRTRFALVGVLKAFSVQLLDRLKAQPAQWSVRRELDWRLREPLARVLGAQYLTLQRVNDQLPQRRAALNGGDFRAPKKVVRQIQCRSHCTKP